MTLQGWSSRVCTPLAAQRSRSPAGASKCEPAVRSNVLFGGSPLASTKVIFSGRSITADLTGHLFVSASCGPCAPHTSLYGHELMVGALRDVFPGA
jgi:hypothetical protein